MYEGWFPPILTFKFCYAILLCCYSVFLGILICMFESYYSLSNFVIHFSDFIMPLWILLFSFEFCYSFSNFVMQLSNPVIRLYSPLMQFWILLFPFQFCYSLFQFYYANINSVIQFPILLFAFDLCSSKCGTSCNKLEIYVSQNLVKFRGGEGEAHKMSAIEGRENWGKLGSFGGRVSTLALIWEGEM